MSELESPTVIGLSPEVIRSRREFIKATMERNGISDRRDRKYIVLHSGDRITDWDHESAVVTPPLVQPVSAGTILWCRERDDKPDLSAIEVIEDRGDNLWVKPAWPDGRDVQFLVPAADAYTIPFPFKPKAIMRRDLRQYVGDEAAREWHKLRQKRIEARKP